MAAQPKENMSDTDKKLGQTTTTAATGNLQAAVVAGAAGAAGAV
jgi:hypothetical protein